MNHRAVTIAETKDCVLITTHRGIHTFVDLPHRNLLIKNPSLFVYFWSESRKYIGFHTINALCDKGFVVDKISDELGKTLTQQLNKLAGHGELFKTEKQLVQEWSESKVS